MRGSVLDGDFDVPLAAVDVQLISGEVSRRTETDDQGGYRFSGVQPGPYTLVFAKGGYQRTVRTDVVVQDGRVTDVNVSLSGEYTDMDEFVVTDMLGGLAGSEQALLELRLDSPSLMDTIGSDMMSRGGFSDVAQALRNVSGTTVADGKSAVIRGLPDRYVSSQMNGVRLPSANEDKRSVDLDLFPAAIVGSIQVSKTFTPDQQGDASGGAVNVETKGVPADPVLDVSLQLGYNTQVTNNSLFRSYDGGGVNTWGDGGDDREMQLDSLGGPWTGAVGTKPVGAPTDYKISGAFGDRWEYEKDVFLGGFLSFFYERDSAYRDNEREDSYWVEDPADGLTPETRQGSAGPDPQSSDFKTALYDITRSSESVQWGGLSTIGVETENHAVNLSYFYSHEAEDKTILAEDTRGKESYFPGYTPDDPTAPGNISGTTDAAPWLRSQSLIYTERTASSMQLAGKHTLPFGTKNPGEGFAWLRPEFDWTLAVSTADQSQPDKRQFASQWFAASYNPGAPPFLPPFTTDPFYRPLNPAANFNMGNFQRIWKEVSEDSDQYILDLKFPFATKHQDDGYFKAGVFSDSIDRTFNQDSFSNFGDQGSSGTLGWDDYWTDVWEGEGHPIDAATVDVDYTGKQNLDATYAMVDLPTSDRTTWIAGVRFESTEISTVNDPEADAVWYPPGSTGPVALSPGDGNVDFAQDDVLPALALVHELSDALTLRLAFSQTVAHQTFKELTPIQQQEYLGGPVFIGNPDLKMSGLDNYDLRLDYQPQAGSFLSVSVFDKRIEDPIEYVKTGSTFSFTTPLNYPSGRLSGLEFEVRQDLGLYTPALEGMSVGANATWISSEVELTPGEISAFDNLGTPITKRDMVKAPENLFNLFLTYDSDDGNTKLGLFYTVQGDTLETGAGIRDGNFVPSVYATEYDTLNFTWSQKLSKIWKLKFQAKNLTNPLIQEVYRSDYTGPDVVHTSYTKGIDYSLSLTASFQF
ncbi:MAG: carboxypeptidase regulatory-like domain-containing protein [Planctomycetota bacterium]